MIKSIEFIEGFPLDLPNVGKKKFEFKKGINLLYGPNGCGKSTIIKTIKGYCAIKVGGWTHPSVPSEIGIGRLNGSDYPHAYSTYTPANCKALVVWDGLPSFFNDGDVKIHELEYFFKFKTAGDGITDENDIEKILTEKPSAGQYRLLKINKVLNLLKAGAPDYNIEDFKGYENKDDNYYANREFKFWNYINRLYTANHDDSCNTVLLDEPERSLSHAKQKEFFLEILPRELKDYQVIIATHSLYSIFTPDANIIEMEDGYIEDFKIAINDIVKLTNFNLPQQLELAL